MEKKLRSWWPLLSRLQPMRKYSLTAALIAFLGIFIILIMLGYLLKWEWTGFSAKNLWDWLQLLFVPIILAIGGFWLNQIQKNRDDAVAQQREKISLDNQKESILQGYLDRMSELLLEEKLYRSKPEEGIRHIARARTLTVLSQLDSSRKRSLIQFLYESQLIMNTTTDNSIVSLSGANLNFISLSNINLNGVDLSQASLVEAKLMQANLSWANLSQVDFNHANFSNANLSWATLCWSKLSGTDLSNVNLSNAQLNRADLSTADLSNVQLNKADLSNANLSGAKVTQEQLEKAKSLKGATMPDGSKHP